MLSSVASSPATDPTADVVVSVLTPALALVVVWLLLSVALTLLAAVVESAHRPTLARYLRSLALPPVRRLVERAVAVSMALSVVTSVAPSAHAVATADTAATDAAGSDSVGDGDTDGIPSPLEEPVVRENEGVTPHASSDPLPTAPTPRSVSPADRGDDAAPDEAVDPDVHVVVAGENLWSVSAQVVGERASAGGRSDTVGDPEIARYWSRLIDINRTSLRSGDPDLVFPGERLTLPPD